MQDDRPVHIGAAIRHVRETLRLKLEMVALDAGFDAGNLSRIETGRQNPSIRRLEAIARAMDVTVADLYALVETPRTLVSADANAQARAHAMSQSEWLQLKQRYETLNAERRGLALEFLLMLQRMQYAEAAAIAARLREEHGLLRMLHPAEAASAQAG